MSVTLKEHVIVKTKKTFHLFTRRIHIYMTQILILFHSVLNVYELRSIKIMKYILENGEGEL